MSERAPQSPPDWHLAAIGEALPGPAEPHPDPIAGNGLRLQLGSQPGTELDLFPATGVVRIATSDVHIALVRQERPTIESSGIVFSRTSETGSSRLTIAPDGTVFLTLSPGSGAHSAVSAPETPADASFSAEHPIDQVGADEPVHDDPVTSETLSGDRSDPESPPGEQPRVSLRGRLGAAPRFRTTPKEVLIGRFPLAVHLPETDTTAWHQVVAFGERAARLQAEALRKGELVSVVGYEHERSFTDKAGNERMEVELFAAVINERNHFMLEHEPQETPPLHQRILETYHLAAERYRVNPGETNLRLLAGAAQMLESALLILPGKFDLGHLVATPGALKTLHRADQLPAEFVLRHHHGDWGDLEPEDLAENAHALQAGSRLVSSYRTRSNEKIWIITEWNRSITTILRPDEY